jgi:hypothetical protein
VSERVPLPETRRPDTARHFERKLEEQGLPPARKGRGWQARRRAAPAPAAGCNCRSLLCGELIVLFCMNLLCDVLFLLCKTITRTLY